jgi:hypothetical protein
VRLAGDEAEPDLPLEVVDVEVDETDACHVPRAK